MRSIHLYIYKIITLTILLGAISLSSFVYATEQQDYDDAKTRINEIQDPSPQGTPTAPLNKDQRGSIANILSRVFNATGKIRSIFISAFDNLTVGYVPSWTGTGFTNSIIGHSGDTINIEGNINIEGEVFMSGGTLNGGVWTEGVGDEIYYNSGSVGVGVASPDSTLHVGGDIKIGDSADTCAVAKAGALRFQASYMQLCTDESGSYVWTTIGGGKFVDGTNPLHASYTAGNVGIGTVAPTTTLQVGGEIYALNTTASQAAIRGHAQGTGGASYGAQFNSDNSIGVVSYGLSWAGFFSSIGSHGVYGNGSAVGGYGIYGHTDNAGYAGVIGYSQDYLSYGILGYQNAYSFAGVGILQNTGTSYLLGNTYIGGTSRYLSTPTGNYGSIQVNGSGLGAYEGFSIDGNEVFMSSGANGTVGIYNDNLNRWRTYWTNGTYRLYHYNNELIINATQDSYTYLYHNGVWRMRTTSAGIQAYAFTYQSDERLKTNIKDLDNSSDILKVTPKIFDWIDGEGQQNKVGDIGIIAQDVEKYFPQFVSVDEDTGEKSVDYPKLVVPLLGTVQAQQDEMDQQQSKIDELKSEVAEIKKMLK